MNIQLAKHYIRHFFTARNEHSIHSPFLFEFYLTCLKEKRNFYAFKEIEKYRKYLLKNTDTITITDLGAGSSVNKNTSRLVKDVAKNSLKQPFLAEQLFRMVNYLKPSTIIELGTSLGVSTSYLANPSSDTTVYTLEGCPNTASIASQTFQTLNIPNIVQKTGHFDKSLPALLEEIDTVDFVFFYGNHQYQPTMDYFNLCKARANENTCFVFDDIYWSEGMTKAWKEIQQDSQVMMSIDTFYFGICFFRTNQPKQHFILR